MIQRRPNRALVFYLTWVNPLIAIAVFYFCSWQSIAGLFPDSSTSAPSTSAPPSLFSSSDANPFAMYFLGKGISCSSALFLFGLFFREYLLRRSETEVAEL